VWLTADAEGFARRFGGSVVTHALSAPRAVKDGWSMTSPARRERYQPGALPLVEPATLAEDL